MVANPNSFDAIQHKNQINRLYAWRKRACYKQTLNDFIPIRTISRESTIKRSLSHLGPKNINFGKPRPIHIKAILKKYAYTTETARGHKNPFYGRKHKQSTKLILSKKAKTRWANAEFRKKVLLRWKESPNGIGLRGRIFSDDHKKNLRESLKNVPRMYRNTKPERMMQIALSLKGIKFEKHRIFKIGKHYHEVDIFIPPNICLEIDGTYWHLNKKQLIKDLIVNSELTIQGYYVLRIRDKDILKNTEKSTEKVMELVNHGQQIPNLLGVI